MKKLIANLILVQTLFSTAIAAEKCPHRILWEVTPAGSLESTNIMGATDYAFTGPDEIIVLNFPKQGLEKAPLQVYRNLQGKWTLDKKTTDRLPQTFHARQIIMDDIEGDGIKEVIISDHGTDKPPFPGSFPVILKKNKNEWVFDESSKKITPAFTFNMAVLPLPDKTNGLYFANVSFDTPILIKKNKKNEWENLNKLVPPGMNKHLCLMTAVKEDFDGNGIPDLFLGGCDRPKINKAQAHDRILFAIDKQWKLLPDPTLPPRRHDAMWGTNFAKTTDLNGDKKPDLIFAIHDWGFHNWELWAYENLSTPWRFKFKEIPIPVKQEPKTEGFIYNFEEFKINGLGTVFIAQVRSVIRDKKNVDPSMNARLFIYENKQFKDISACLPEEFRRNLYSTKKYPDSNDKLLLLPFKGEMLNLSGKKL